MFVIFDGTLVHINCNETERPCEHKRHGRASRSSPTRVGALVGIGCDPRSTFDAAAVCVRTSLSCRDLAAMSIKGKSKPACQQEANRFHARFRDLGERECAQVKK